MTAIVLVGLMGAGKTTVGRAVAELTGRPLVDVDDAIRERTGLTVRELWEQGGEAAYRGHESQVVLDALRDGDDVVLAAPGGAVLDPEVRAALTGAVVVWLRAPTETLASRVRRDDHRPLLGDDPAGRLGKMAADRDELYASLAELTIDTAVHGPRAAADAIVAHLDARTPTS